MNIYKGLEDPDAVTGLVTVRTTGPTSTDWILAAEKAGRWDDAAALYEVEMTHHSALCPSAAPAALSRAAAELQEPATRAQGSSGRRLGAAAAGAIVCEIKCSLESQNDAPLCGACRAVTRCCGAARTCYTRTGFFWACTGRCGCRCECLWNCSLRR